MTGSMTHVGIGGEMKHKINSGHGALQRIAVEQVGADQTIGRALHRPFDKPLLPRREVVVANHRMAALQQPVRKVASHEAGGPSYEKVQVIPFLLIPLS